MQNIFINNKQPFIVVTAGVYSFCQLLHFYDIDMSFNYSVTSFTCKQIADAGVPTLQKGVTIMLFIEEEL